jgi:hypothetical protein
MSFTIGTDANGNVSLYAAQSASGTTSLLATINKVNTYTSGKTSLRSLIGTWGQSAPVIYYVLGMSFNYNVYENNYGDISYLEVGSTGEIGYVESSISSADLEIKINNKVSQMCTDAQNYYYQNYGTQGSTYVCEVTYRDAFSFQTK